MKRILVVFAMPEELKGFFPDRLPRRRTVNGMSVYALKLGKNQIFAMIAGIGKVAMAYRLGVVIPVLKPTLIINTGVAGSLSQEAKPLSILVATKTAYHDADVTAFGYKRGQMAKEPLYYACDRKAITRLTKRFPGEILTGLILSGDQFMSHEKIPTWFDTEFDHPLAVDMESAAVGQVAAMAAIPYVIIRTISDDGKGAETSKAQYEKLLKEASDRAGAMTRYLVQ
jgi:adenosylhomocysteine nucleosidase